MAQNNANKKTGGTSANVNAMMWSNQNAVKRPTGSGNGAHKNNNSGAGAGVQGQLNRHLTNNSQTKTSEQQKAPFVDQSQQQ